MSLLLSRLMSLTDAQEGVLNIAFRVADEEALPLLDLKDLQALLTFVGESADVDRSASTSSKAISTPFVSTPSALVSTSQLPS